jgi:hypothetical protein
MKTITIILTIIVGIIKSFDKNGKITSLSELLQLIYFVIAIILLILFL